VGHAYSHHKPSLPHQIRYKVNIGGTERTLDFAQLRNALSMGGNTVMNTENLVIRKCAIVSAAMEKNWALHPPGFIIFGDNGDEIDPHSMCNSHFCLCLLLDPSPPQIVE
jgi:hypothetical protein